MAEQTAGLPVFAAAAADLIVFIAVTVCVIRSVNRKKQEKTLKQRMGTFRYFTTDSNVLCALSCLCTLPWLIGAMFSGESCLPRPLLLFRFAGTAAVTVTFLTVMAFLGPTTGYRPLLTGHGFWMHLLCPVLAVLSLALEKSEPFSFPETLWGMLPTVVYSLVYLYEVVLKKDGWEDFYGFDRGGKWPVSIVLMYLATAGICAALNCV